MSNQPTKNSANFTFAEIRQATEATSTSFFEGKVAGVVTDSRQIEGGNLFVALRGEKFDGHKFLEQVKNQGAVAALVEERQAVDLPQLIVPDTLKALGDLARFHRERFDLPVIAVTGSYGKTSTRSLIEAGFAGFDILAAQGNFNNEIGLPLTLLGLKAHHKAAILEMGMRGRGQIAYLAAIARPTIGVITNIGPQHIELLGSVEEIALAKAELLEALPPDGLAVLPADSPFLSLLQANSPCKTVTFGTGKTADYPAEKIETEADGSVSFSVLKGAAWRLKLPFPGAHNAVNAVAALAVFDGGYAQLGITLESVVANFATAQLPGARMRVLKLENGITMIDDCYNAGPDSTRAALQTLLDFPGSGRRVAVLGAMRELGNFSEAEHVKIGRFAGQFVEVLVGVAGDTRPLLNAALQAAKEVENEMQVSYCDNAAEAASRVGEWLQSGDVVLVKGSRSIGLEAVVEAVKGL